jgi:hypothetical protein
MKEEYDFTNAEQGKFYVPIEELDIPIYLDEEVKRFFLKKLKNKNKDMDLSLSSIVNALLLKDIEISKRLAI